MVGTTIEAYFPEYQLVTLFYTLTFKVISRSNPLFIYFSMGPPPFLHHKWKSGKFNLDFTLKWLKGNKGHGQGHSNLESNKFCAFHFWCKKLRFTLRNIFYHEMALKINVKFNITLPDSQGNILQFSYWPHFLKNAIHNRLFGYMWVSIVMAWVSAVPARSSEWTKLVRQTHTASWVLSKLLDKFGPTVE